jgi:hypothetical protein
VHHAIFVVLCCFILYSLTFALSLSAHTTVGLHQPWLCDRA